MRNLLKNLLALLIGICFAILILEVFLHVYNPFTFRQKGDKIVLPANVQLNYKNVRIRGVDSAIIHTKNSLGFRGPEKPEAFENYTSLIAVGGSTTECLYLSDGQDWGSLLGSKLQERFDKVWTNNAGLDGHSTFGHQILLDDYLIKMNPTYVLFLIGANDMGRSDLGSYDKLSLKKEEGWRTTLKNNSEVVSLILNLKRNFKARKAKLIHSSVDFQQTEQVDSIQIEDIQNMVSYHSPYLAPFEDRLNGLISTTQTHHIVPILITQPTLVGYGVDAATGINLEKVKLCNDLAGKVYWKQMELYNDVTRSVAKKRNIFLIDLAKEMPNSTELYYDCIHFTNKGAEKVSQIIYQSMERVLSKQLEINKEN